MVASTPLLTYLSMTLITKSNSEPSPQTGEFMAECYGGYHDCAETFSAEASPEPSQQPPEPLYTPQQRVVPH